MDTSPLRAQSEWYPALRIPRQTNYATYGANCLSTPTVKSFATVVWVVMSCSPVALSLLAGSLFVSGRRRHFRTTDKSFFSPGGEAAIGSPPPVQARGTFPGHRRRNVSDLPARGGREHRILSTSRPLLSRKRLSDSPSACRAFLRGRRLFCILLTSLIRGFSGGNRNDHRDHCWRIR